MPKKARVPRYCAAAVFAAWILATGWACQAPPTGETPAGEDGVTVSGRLLTASGEPPVLAHVHVGGPISGIRFDAQETVDVGDDGSFRLTVDRDGAHQLVATALHHQSATVPLVVADGADGVEIELTLQAQSAADAGVIRIQGDGDLDADMERRDDGTWAYTVEQPGEKVSYRIRVGGFDGHDVDGTQADEYEPRGSYGYSAVVRASDGPAEIVFDPARLPPPGDADLPRLVTDDTSLARAFALKQDMKEASKAWKEVLRTGGEPDWSEVYASAHAKIAEALGDTGSAALRGYAAARVLTLMGDVVTDEEERLALEQLPADSPLWSLVGINVQGIDPEEHGELLQALRAGHPDTTVRAMAVAALIRGAKEAGDKDRWQELYAELGQVDAKEVPFVKPLLGRLNPDARIAVGEPVPDFELALFDSTFEGRGKVSKADLSGSVYLIDFWGTWCAPCVAEIPKINEVWEEYKGEGFQVLSVAVENSPDLIRAFRDEKHPMPWLHHYVEGGFDGELLKTFEVTGYPKPILVGAEGEILATGDLRGEDLMTTVGEALGR